jgi:hypothetical protein
VLRSTGWAVGQATPVSCRDRAASMASICWPS